MFECRGVEALSGGDGRLPKKTLPFREIQGCVSTSFVYVIPDVISSGDMTPSIRISDRSFLGYPSPGHLVL